MKESRSNKETSEDLNLNNISQVSDRPQSEFAYLANYRTKKTEIHKSDVQFQIEGNLGDVDEHQFIELNDLSCNQGLLFPKSDNNLRLNIASVQEATLSTSKIPYVQSIPLQSFEVNYLSKQVIDLDVKSNQKPMKPPFEEKKDFLTPTSIISQSKSRGSRMVGQYQSPRNQDITDRKQKLEQRFVTMKDSQKVEPGIAADKILLDKVISKETIQSHVQNFIKILKQRIVHMRTSDTLTFHTQKLINDISTSTYYKYFNEEQRFNIKRENQLGFSERLSRLKITIFLPHQPLSIFFDCLTITFISCFLFFYSILLFFAQQVSDQSSFDYYFMVAILLFGLDIIANFQRAYFYQDCLITDHLKIAINYVKSDFFADALSFAVLIYRYFVSKSQFTFNPNNEMINYIIDLLLYSKVYSLSTKKKRILKGVILQSHTKHLLRLLHQIFIVIVSAHTMCVLWNVVCIIENSLLISNNWQTKIGIQDFLWYEIYIYSLYWAMTTMSTVGYGDITPANPMECLFVTIAMIFMSCIFAYSINNIGMLLNEIEKDSQELNDNLQIMGKFLQSKDVDVELQMRIKNYLIHLSKESKKRNKSAEDSIIKKLSNKLRNEMIIEIHSKILKSFSLFGNNFSQQVNTQLLFALEEIVIQPNQIIFSEQDYDEDQAMYFISSGKVEIFTTYLNRKQKQQCLVLTTLGSNQYFGEIAFFTDSTRTASARSVNQTALYKLSKKVFLKILLNFKEDFERYKMIQHQILLQNELSLLNIECYSCKQLGHIAHDCPFIHGNFDKQFLTLKENFSYFQNRNKRIEQQFTRKNMQEEAICQTPIPTTQNFIRKKLNTRLIRNQITQAAVNFKQQAVYMGSEVFHYFNEMNERQVEDDGQNRSHSSLKSDQNMSSDSSEEPDKKQNISKNVIKEAEFTDLNDQPNATKKRELSIQKSKDEDFGQQSQLDMQNSTIQAISHNSKRDLNHDQQNPSNISQGTIKSLGVDLPQSSNNKKIILQVNNKDTLANIGSKIVISRTDNALFSNDTPNNGGTGTIEREQYSQQLSETHKKLLPHSLNSAMIVQPVVSHSFDSNQRVSKLSNQIKNMIMPSSNITAYQDVEASLLKNMHLYEISEFKKPSLRNNEVIQELKDIQQLIISDKQYPYDKLENFETLKIFKRFFPYNNFDKVLKAIKQTSSENQKGIPRKKKQVSYGGGRQSKFITGLLNFDMLQILYNSRPTSSSYGVFTKFGQVYPVNNNISL